MTFVVMYDNVVLKSRRSFAKIPDCLDRTIECFGKDTIIKSHTETSVRHSWRPRKSGTARPKLVRSEGAWKPIKKAPCAKWSTNKPDNTLVTGTLTGLLNKLTPEKFSSISESLLTLVKETDTLNLFVGLLVTKAVSQTTYIPLYTQLCCTFWEQLDTFQEVLLDKLNFSFVTGNRWENTSVNLEESDKNSKKKERVVGNFKFIAELYKYNMVSTELLCEALHNLIADPLENEIETFTSMLSAIGKKLEKEAKMEVDVLFDKISLLKSKFSTRTKFMIMDLEDLRVKQAWVPRLKSVTPKTLKEVKQDHMKEISPPVRTYQRLNLTQRVN